MNKLFHPLVLIAALIIIALGFAAWLLPLQLAHKTKQAIEQETGRSFSVKSGASWTLQPSPALLLHEVQLDGVSALSSEILTAKSLAISPTGAMYFEEANVTVALNDLGRSNLLTGNELETNKFTPRNVHFHNSHFHYVDVQSKLNFDLADVSGDFKISGLGEIDGAGSASLAGRTVQFSTTLASLPRITKDGSPLELNINSKEEQFSFSGRLNLKSGLNLAGQASMNASDLAKTIAWTGSNYKALKSAQKFSIEGAVEVQDADFNFTSAKLQLGTMKGQGDLNLSFASQKPSLNAKLGFDVLDLNSFAASEKAIWNEVPFDKASLQALTANFQIAANKIIYQTLQSGPAKLSGILEAGGLSTQFTSNAGSTLDVQFNGATLSLKTHLETIAAPLSTLALDATATTTGESEAEMIANLSGDAQARVSSLDLNNMNSTGTATLELKDGIATITDNQFESPTQKFNLQGEIDLLRRTVSLSTSTLGDKKLLIHGPWLKPITSSIAASLQ
jgi:hypothetical protein